MAGKSSQIQRLEDDESGLMRLCCSDSRVLDGQFPSDYRPPSLLVVRVQSRPPVLCGLIIAEYASCPPLLAYNDKNNNNYAKSRRSTQKMSLTIDGDDEQPDGKENDDQGRSSLR